MIYHVVVVPGNDFEIALSLKQSFFLQIVVPGYGFVLLQIDVLDNFLHVAVNNFLFQTTF